MELECAAATFGAPPGERYGDASVVALGVSQRSRVGRMEVEARRDLTGVAVDDVLEHRLEERLDLSRDVPTVCL